MRNSFFCDSFPASGFLTGWLDDVNMVNNSRTVEARVRNFVSVASIPVMCTSNIVQGHFQACEISNGVFEDRTAVSPVRD